MGIETEPESKNGHKNTIVTYKALHLGTSFVDVVQFRNGQWCSYCYLHKKQSQCTDDRKPQEP